ncbi:MAG TPA: putative lipid II flippase FtsW [Streptosporangiaceae bacterium]
MSATTALAAQDAADAGAILRSDNGGRGWSQIAELRGVVTQLDFWSASDGVAASYQAGTSAPWQLWATSDGGTIWEPYGPLPGGDADIYGPWMSANGNGLLLTVAGGNPWQAGSGGVPPARVWTTNYYGLNWDRGAPCWPSATPATAGSFSATPPGAPPTAAARGPAPDGNLGRHAPDVPVLPLVGEQTWTMHQGVTFGERPSGGSEGFQVSWPGDGTVRPDLPVHEGLTSKGLPGLGSVRDRIGLWRALVDRPLTSYYLVLGITTLLLGLGLVMVQSTASVADLSAGLSPYSDFKKQLLGAAIGLPLMWVAARSSPRLFRAFAYPLLAVAVVGLGLTLIHGVGVSQNGAARWISIGGQQVQPSEIAKLALVVWGADLLARKDKLGQLADWRHMLVPLMPGTAVLCLLVMTGDDLGTTFILLVIFLALLWVIGTPGRVFGGMLILISLAIALMMVSSKYRMDRILGFLDPQGGPTGPYMQSIQGKYALGSGGITGVGLGASGEKWGWVPESTDDYIFAILGEELGLMGTLCVTFLYGLLAFAGLRIARRVPDLFSRLAVTGITAWIVMQAVVNIGVVIGVLPITGVPLPLLSAGLSSLLVTLIALGMLMSFARLEPGAQEALAARGPGWSLRVLSWLGLAKRRR